MKWMSRFRLPRRRNSPESSTASSRHPFELFLLVICVISGIPTLFNTPAPASIEALLPSRIVVLWSFTLVLGAAIALVGIAWKNRIVGLLIEQAGLVAVGVAAVIYAIAIFRVVGAAGAIPGAIILSFGMSCLWRWHQLQQIVDDLVNAKSEV